MERDDVILSRTRYSLYCKESDKILFCLLVLVVPTLFSKFIKIPTLQGQLNLEPLSHWLYPLVNDPYEVINICKGRRDEMKLSIHPSRPVIHFW